MISRILSIFLFFMSLFSLYARVMASGDRIVGGECEYKQYKGHAEIVSVTPIVHPGYPSDRYEARFKFTPDQKIEEPFAQTEGRYFLLLPDYKDYLSLNFIEKYDIRPGKVLDCTLRVIINGTCTPMLFDFPFIIPEVIKGN